MKRNLALHAVVLVVTVLLVSNIFAAVPILLTQQGRLLDTGSSPVNGMRDLTFSIFESPAGGAPLWTETHFDVQITSGLYTVTLGSVTSLPIDVLETSSSVQTERWLEIRVEVETLSPRLRLGSAPYSVASSRVSGDVSTTPGQLQLSGMSGSTTATIRSSNNPGGGERRKRS